jgi:hypothetical protein
MMTKLKVGDMENEPKLQWKVTFFFDFAKVLGLLAIVTIGFHLIVSLALCK